MKHMVAGRIVPPAPEKSAIGAMGVKLPSKSKEDQTSQVGLSALHLDGSVFPVDAWVHSAPSFFFPWILAEPTV